MSASAERPADIVATHTSRRGLLAYLSRGPARSVACAGGRRISTLRGVPFPPRRSAPRQPQPRDYLDEPLSFGIDPDARFTVPPDGDEHALRAAAVQHHLAIQLRRLEPAARRNGARAGRLFGFSRQHWSDCLVGRSWMGPATYAAAIAALLDIQERISDTRR